MGRRKKESEPDLKVVGGIDTIERPATGWYGEDYREIIGRPDLGEEWKVPDPMQGDFRPKKPKG
jgi:hypothetical protein